MKSNLNGMLVRAVAVAIAFTRPAKLTQLSLLLAAGLLLPGCGGNAKVASAHDPTGAYTLVTVNGSKVPTTVSHEGSAIEVRSGTFTVNADGTCGSKTVFVPPSGSEVSREG